MLPAVRQAVLSISALLFFALPVSVLKHSSLKHSEIAEQTPAEYSAEHFYAVQKIAEQTAYSAASVPADFAPVHQTDRQTAHQIVRQTDRRIVSFCPYSSPHFRKLSYFVKNKDYIIKITGKTNSPEIKRIQSPQIRVRGKHVNLKIQKNSHVPVRGRLPLLHSCPGGVGRHSATWEQRQVYTYAAAEANRKSLPARFELFTAHKQKLPTETICPKESKPKYCRDHNL